ncbi:MAG: hypothetical protein M3P83_13775, partial [Actinomycetota bacterium]|nr:hypothetical protein [Actinomycetota bacterium]
MTLQRTELDGVPVFWLTAPLPLSATLLFRVGGRDETFRTVGISHLVEHLAMSTLGRRRHEYNATVDLTFTAFTATGREAAVVSYLADVCTALAALPMDRLRTEAKVLTAEAGQVVHPAVGELLRQRFGPQGVGLAGVQSPALEQLQADEVVAFAARHLTRGNAALALTGPPPDSLRLALPSGSRIEPPVDTPLDLPLPMWCPLGGPAVAVSLLVPTGDSAQYEAAAATLRIALDRAMDELRHRHGWCYDVDLSLEPTGAHSVACLYSDPPDEHAEDVRRGRSRSCRTCATTGRPSRSSTRTWRTSESTSPTREPARAWPR